MTNTGFELVGFTPTALDTSSLDLPPSNPITIISGTAEQQVQFSAFPDDGTITVEYFGNGYTEFDAEEFGLIAALLINTAQGDY